MVLSESGGGGQNVIDYTCLCTVCFNGCCVSTLRRHSTSSGNIMRTSHGISIGTECNGSCSYKCAVRVTVVCVPSDTSMCRICPKALRQFSLLHCTHQICWSNAILPPLLKGMEPWMACLHTECEYLHQLDVSRASHSAC